MDLGLSDSIAVVTGGSSGIGLATARLLLADGARVAICGRDADRLVAAVERLGTPNTDALLAMQPEPHMVCTSAARAGGANLLKSLAAEFAPRIRVNSVLLGLIDSGQWQRRFEARTDKSQSRTQWMSELAADKKIPLGRLGDPDEPARAIVFLGSRAASYITGASLEISGGVSRSI